ncbi:MAG: hypothetical protein J0J10_23755, partial [Bosea sp.]|uniref:hypothetical protein n=1 Tax=Bosea sp. (in: a-proteobacteria) TaxID=1871050 RepID=UPI001AC876BF
STRFMKVFRQKHPRNKKDHKNNSLRQSTNTPEQHHNTTIPKNNPEGPETVHQASPAKGRIPPALPFQAGLPARPPGIDLIPTREAGMLGLEFDGESAARGTSPTGDRWTRPSSPHECSPRTEIPA